MDQVWVLLSVLLTGRPTDRLAYKLEEQGVRNAITNQGLNSWEAFKIITLDDMTELCRHVRRPGGTIPNPAGGAEIPNPGQQIGTIHEL